MLKSNSQTLSADKTNSQPLIASPKVNINPTGKYYALLIGNSNYTHWSSLKSPINFETGFPDLVSVNIPSLSGVLSALLE